ncbi:MULTISPECIES: class I SAM-dependent methyltransferase [unclassified Mucilaginibacter]|uniref:class I SAM-dependent methyltransferase n=1 Tax=unclassified Mucilaginibacter TaxID=2617802 RepID=UPI002AC9357B|nr:MULTISPECIES: class I SAM-dependent methyltransferase [unclassified Mucilaginibacter]MEB0260646.1 class I SAM-dependent methyltransferase [Mucilaginibacter sp. 10I4]MEB0277469.1 class I SAM-dependent methyltransferase [Mucilaginibacter sp. 10B2]MEB0302332.1 class I SAM-dependent methyltransferase [Mucilaginibacter sp. 5C4]WPX24901.1 class I SAM-dependent methyltransferase [Mucilaginibacter sp. 5C4]
MDYNDQYSHKDKMYYLHRRTEILPFVPQGIKSALDVGCATGGFGALLKETFDCEVWGVEPDTESAGAAQKNIDVVINDLFTDNMPQLATKKFDTIFFNDVLEHLQDPDKALLACKKLLNPNGVIIASIPNIRWYPVVLSLLRYKDFKYEDAGVMDRTHLRFFTKKSMIRLFEQSGYSVTNIQGINESNFRYYKLLNFMLFNTQQDMNYPQFVIVAKLSA